MFGFLYLVKVFINLEQVASFLSIIVLIISAWHMLTRSSIVQTSHKQSEYATGDTTRDIRLDSRLPPQWCGSTLQRWPCLQILAPLWHYFSQNIYSHGQGHWNHGHVWKDFLQNIYSQGHGYAGDRVDSHSHDSWSNFIIFAVVVYKPMSRSDATNLTFPLQVILTKQQTFITTTTSTTATTTSTTTTTTSTTTTTTRRWRWATIGTERLETLTRLESQVLQYVYFFYFFEYLTNFFLQIDYKWWRWWRHKWWQQRQQQGLEMQQRLEPLVSFFFSCFFLFLWLIHIFTVATRTPPSLHHHHSLKTPANHARRWKGTKQWNLGSVVCALGLETWCVSSPRYKFSFIFSFFY